MYCDMHYDVYCQLWPSSGGEVPIWTLVAGLEDELKEWRRTGLVSDLSGREVSKVAVIEYLVKLRGYSYLHAKWMNAAEVEEDGALSANALKKFERRIALDEPVDTFYEKHMIIERVIAHRHKRGQLEYMVKTHGLSYAECSWERAKLLSEADAMRCIQTYHAACHIEMSAVASVSKSTATAWLKSGVQLELASVGEYGGGSWAVVKLLESVSGKVQSLPLVGPELPIQPEQPFLPYALCLHKPQQPLLRSTLTTGACVDRIHLTCRSTGASRGEGDVISGGRCG